MHLGEGDSYYVKYRVYVASDRVIIPMKTSAPNTDICRSGAGKLKVLREVLEKYFGRPDPPQGGRVQPKSTRHKAGFKETNLVHYKYGLVEGLGEPSQPKCFLILFTASLT